MFHQCKFLTCIFARFHQQLQKLRSLPPELYIKLDSSSCVNTEEMGNQASDFRVECKCRSNSLLESPCLYLVACLVRDGSKNNYSETHNAQFVLGKEPEGGSLGEGKKLRIFVCSGLSILL